MCIKYYSVRYLIHLSFLHYALHSKLYCVITDLLSQSLMMWSVKRLHQTHLIKSQTRDYMSSSASVKSEEVSLKIMQDVKMCIKTTIQSTVAFDDVYK